MIRKKLGRNPLVDSYPDLIKKAVEFIKLNGYSARALVDVILLAVRGLVFQ